MVKVFPSPRGAEMKGAGLWVVSNLARSDFKAEATESQQLFRRGRRAGRRDTDGASSRPAPPLSYASQVTWSASARLSSAAPRDQLMPEASSVREAKAATVTASESGVWS